MPSLAESGFDELPMQVAIVDPAGAIVRTNDAWGRFDDWGAATEPTDPVGVNYLRVCREGVEAGRPDDDGDRSRVADGGVFAAGSDGAAADGAAVADGIEAVLAGDRETFDHEYPCHSPEERRWFLMRASGVDRDGTTFAQVVHLDITDRKLAEEAVESRNDRLETLAGVLGHDLRNPLQVVQGHTDLLRARLDGDDGESDGRPAPEEAVADLETIRSSAGRIEAIIEDALRLARGGAATEEEEATTVRLRETAECAWDHVRAEEATIEVADSFGFDARPGPLGQVFENLFANAVEHVGPDVTVTVGALDADGTGPSGFYVADDGPGVPPGDRSVVFDAGHTSDTDGTGLGLAIVEQFVESEGWYVTLVESAAGGARFEVRGVDAV